MQNIFAIFPLTFVIYYIATLIVTLTTLKLFFLRRTCYKFELIIDSICLISNLVGILVGIVFQMRIAEQPYGNIFGNYATQLFILLICTVICSVIYYSLAYTRFKRYILNTKTKETYNYEVHH